MKIGLITTINTNIGDDFIREGLVRVLKRAFPDRSLTFVPINKHEPETVYPPWHPYHKAEMARRLPKGKDKVPRLIRWMSVHMGMTEFDSCDLIVQCGTPVIWEGCGRTTAWAKTLWHEVIGRIHERVPVFNLAAGSCYAWERQPDTIVDATDRDYLRALGRYCRVTTVRDTLACLLLASLGIQAEVIPCSALLAAEPLPAPPSDDGVIMINYMSGGGHYDWDQIIDAETWKAEVRVLIRRLETRHRVVMLCHDARENQLAENIAPHLPRRWPKTPQDYYRSLADVKAAVCNRMHACIGLAGRGIASVGVGTDTRMLMVRQAGLSCLYVKEAGADQLETLIEDLVQKRESEYERLINLQRETEDHYLCAVMRNRVKIAV